MPLRAATCSLLCTWFVVALGACKGFDGALLHPLVAVAQDAGHDAAVELRDATLDEPDAGHDAPLPAGPCVAETERCNGRDDDCDKKVDEGGDQWCADHVIQHAAAVCNPMGKSAVCVKFGSCDPGFDSCDGDPRNGCEAAFCVCHTCDDAGSDDAG